MEFIIEIHVQRKVEQTICRGCWVQEKEGTRRWRFVTIVRHTIPTWTYIMEACIYFIRVDSTVWIPQFLQHILYTYINVYMYMYNIYVYIMEGRISIIYQISRTNTIFFVFLKWVSSVCSSFQAWTQLCTVTPTDSLDG